MSAPVVLAVQQGDALRVFVRNGDDELRQVSESLVRADVDPLRLVTLVADLDSQLGWTGSAAVAAGGRVLDHPAVAAAVAKALPPSKAKRSQATTGTGTGVTSAAHAAQLRKRRARLLARIEQLRVVRAADLDDLYDGKGSRTGIMYGDLNALVRQGKVVRSGEPGTGHGGEGYRWTLVA